MELPPLTVGTVLNKEQAQFVLKKGLLPFGTCVKHTSEGYQNAFGVIVPPRPSGIDSAYLCIVHSDIHERSGCNRDSVEYLEIYPPLSPESWQIFLERTKPKPGLRGVPKYGFNYHTYGTTIF